MHVACRHSQAWPDLVVGHHLAVEVILQIVFRTSSMSCGFLTLLPATMSPIYMFVGFQVFRLNCTASKLSRASVKGIQVLVMDLIKQVAILAAELFCFCCLMHNLHAVLLSSWIS